MEAAVKRMAGELITLYVNPVEHLPLVYADRLQMGQLLLNLVISAYHSRSGSGDVLVETQNSEGPEDSNTVTLTVRCSARVGAAAGHTPLFEPFLSGMERSAASGLALFTAHEIVRELGGALHLMNYEWGTELSVALPALPLTAELHARKTADPARSGLKVLLVEDDSMVREFMRMALEENKFEVLEAENAARAFAITRDVTSIDLLITDLIMPETTGIELYRLLKKDADLPVVFISGYPDDVLVSAGMAEFASSFLAKPFTMEDLIDRVNEILDARRIKLQSGITRAALDKSAIASSRARPCTEDPDPESGFVAKGTRFQIASRQVLSFTEQRLHDQ